ncbi:anhydro-N-acetylmuramic acid kinase [Parahaliea mediterranea]|uniref:anhydro-N-acetylmuramic acid kinase n=1 Tax=Parahaliea mediterranea TaxID=651086 RepID=UPI000E2F3677|nr:anhydro-N-acetylmuramic acid kinase [Parahaliea mediterranea]
MPDPLFIGLMSGTSVDGIDCALTRITPAGVELLATCEHPIADDTRRRITAISQRGDNEIERMGALDRELGELFASATLALLEQSGHRAEDIRAIGSHGQTIRHLPPSVHRPPEYGFTLQIGDPNTIAERTGITTVADFRRRDIATGGEGAPLAPAFHAAAFAAQGLSRVILNIGGIANASLLDGAGGVRGFDTGPGNTLLDHWVQRHQGRPYDRDGQWAAEGEVDSVLLAQLLAHDFLARTGPRSTGKEAFNLAWLDQQLQQLPHSPEPQAVQSTLAEFTAASIAESIAREAGPLDEVYVCGGGARNTDLMRRLYRRLSPARLDTTAALGIDPEWVEAAAFAWLAWRTLGGLAGNVPAVTGANRDVVLGGIYPAAGAIGIK